MDEGNLIMQDTRLLHLSSKAIEHLGKMAEQLKKIWSSFFEMRLLIPEYHRYIQNVYNHIDQFVLKIEYLESPTLEDFRFLRDLIIELQAAIQNKHLLKECIQKKVARKIPQEYITQTKRAITSMEKILNDTRKILNTCYKIILKLLNVSASISS